MKQPLVSVIVPTYNSANFLRVCLDSIKNQTYTNIELVVIDNNSKDNTKQIASEYTTNVFNQGPERSFQRNYGVEQSKGEYVVIIDSDMKLSEKVITECINKFANDKNITGLVIPEESFGKGFWAQCKKLEKSFYVGISWMEAARAFKRETYISLGGYDTNMISGEDWDLSQRVEKAGKLSRISALIFHDEGNLKLIKTLKKKYYYAQKFAEYQKKNKSEKNISNQTGIISRYKLFFSKPKYILNQPITFVGMLFMKTAEFGVGALGILRTL